MILRIRHLLSGHVGTWLEERHGVWHRVCACGWVEPAPRITCRELTSRQAYDYKKAVKARKLADRLAEDRRQLALRRAGESQPAAVVVSDFARRRSQR